MTINCGYPVHLAITKRPFLNKLVYRFPPGPNYALDATHESILRLLQKWVVALCERSPHRNDFGNIRLMYSLLKSKGFTFPSVDESEIGAVVGLGESVGDRTEEGTFGLILGVIGAEEPGRGAG